MKTIIQLGLLMIAAAVVLIALFGSSAASTAVNRQYDHLEQPPSAVDMVMESRQTPPEQPKRAGQVWAVVTFILFCLVALGGILLFLWRGEMFLKQWRLLKKKASTPMQRAPGMGQQQFYDEAGRIPQARNIRQLPEQYYEDNYPDY